MSHLLAIDPGSKESGWVLVKRETTRVRFVTSGTIPSTWRGVHTALRATDDLVGLATTHYLDAIAIEVAEGFIHQPFRGPHLLATAEMVGIITGLAEAISMPVIRFTAAQVRKALVGKATSPKKGLMDKLIAEAVRANVIGFGDSNVHTRDAAALAIVANWQMVARRVA